MHSESFVYDLGMVLGVAAVTSLIFRLLKQPSTLGYLVAGLIIGPYIPGPLFADPERVHALSEFGVILVMFAIGLEFRIAKLLQVLPVAGFAALVQMSGLFVAGYMVGRALDFSVVASLFVGACICISSTMLVSKMFSEQRVDTSSRTFVLSILVLQDVVAIALIATMTAVAKGGGLDGTELLLLLLKLGLTLVGLAAGGLFLIPRLVRLTSRLKSPEATVVVSTGLCFVMAVLADRLGYSVALGAFVAGMLVAESGRAQEVEHSVQPVRDMFAAVFFVSIGMAADPRLAFEYAGTSLALAGVIIVAQLSMLLLGGVLSGVGLRRSVFAGLALGQIGEFAFIIVEIGRSARVVPKELPPILVTVAVLTTFTTPILLKQAARIVHGVDVLLPSRLSHLLSLYEAWLERARSAPWAGTSQRSPLLRALRAVLIDCLVLFGIMALWSTWSREIGTFLVSALDLPKRHGSLAAACLAALLCAFPLFVLIHNTRTLASHVSKRVFEGATGASRRLLALAVETLVFVGLSLPAIAVTAPLWELRYIMPGVAVIAVILLAVLWRAAGRVEAELQSSAARFGTLLARQSLTAPVASPEASGVEVAPGVDQSVKVAVSANCFATDRTLGELDLRANSGASVMAIQRPDSSVVFPRGSERLREGDVLVLVGSTEACERASSRLLRGGEDADDSDPDQGLQPA